MVVGGQGYHLHTRYSDRTSEVLVQRLTDEPGLYLETPYAQHLRTSSSISTLGGPSGTMGGFSELAEEAGEPSVLGLTC